MAYINQADMINAFGNDEILQLTDKNNIGVIDSAVLDVVMIFASSLLDSAASKIYTIPLVGTLNNSAKGILCDIARYRLYDDALTDVVIDNYKLAMKWLDSIATGKMILLDNASAQFDKPALGGGIVKVGTRTQIFNSATMAKYY